MVNTIEAERALAKEQNQEGLWSVFQGRNFIRFIIASWPKITQQLVGLTVFNTYATYFFQYAGYSNPFIVTVILGCVQLLSMLVTASTTDTFGRRPLTVYPYGVTSLSLLSLGIIGCFDYKQSALSSLLVSFRGACIRSIADSEITDLLCVPGYFYNHRSLCHWLCLCC